MSIGTLAQIATDIFLGLGVFICSMRLARAPKDDPRLSRGLQMLQSKIAVLEDLSDRCEAQERQISALLEQKSLDLQARIEDAERHVQAVRASIQRSLEVARIFEDKIPHAEIIERRQTARYVQAARLAHQGATVDEIAERVQLPRGELEFIAKVNKNRLMFSEDQLPEWAAESAGAPPPFGEGPFAQPMAGFAPLPSDLDLTAPESTAASPSEALEALGAEFRRACEGAAAGDAPAAFAPEPPPAPREAMPAIRKVEFPRISTNPTDSLR